MRDVLSLEGKTRSRNRLLLNQRFDVLVFDIDIAILLIALATMQLFACIATAFVVTATFMK